MVTSKRQQKEGKFGIWWTGCFKVLLLYRSNCMEFFCYCLLQQQRSHMQPTPNLSCSTELEQILGQLWHCLVIPSCNISCHWEIDKRRETRNGSRRKLIPQQEQNNRVMTHTDSLNSISILTVCLQFRFLTEMFCRANKLNIRTLKQPACAPRPYCFAFSLANRKVILKQKKTEADPFSIDLSSKQQNIPTS